MTLSPPYGACPGRAISQDTVGQLIPGVPPGGPGMEPCKQLYEGASRARVGGFRVFTLL